jgi:Astacin (Peptidase family M12A)
VFRVRESLILPEIESGKFEGDIMLTEEQMRVLKSPQGRTGLIDLSARWPNAIIPYEIEEGIFNEDQLREIQLAMHNVEVRTCIRFLRRAGDADFLRITVRKGANNFRPIHKLIFLGQR